MTKENYSIDKIFQEIKKIENQIEDAKTSVARLEGQLETSYNNMEQEFGVRTLEEAIEKEKELSSILEDKKEKIEKQYIKLKKEYEW